MSLQVYFDNQLIDEKYYTGLNNSFEIFNESFKLGSTPSNKYTLNIAKEGVETQPTSIKLYEDNSMFADLEIDNIEEKDYEYVYTLTDKMVNLEFYYDASEIFQNGTTKLLLIVEDICSKVGLTLGTVDFRGYDKNISWYDNTRTAREYIGYVAELNGGFARIENGILYFRKQNTNSVKTISIDDCDSFRIGEKHKITRVVYELGTVKYEFGDEAEDTLYLNSNNVFITEKSEVEAIYNDIKDFEFYSFGTDNCPIDYDVKAGDIITFTDGTMSYPTIAQYNLNYYQTWYGGYDLSVNTEKQEETKIIGDKERIKNIQITVDRQNNTISQVVSEVDEQNSKISTVEQTVNELNSKITNIADITTQAETIYASLSFTDINQSEPIEIKIHPTTTNISYLYPRNNLFPSDTLYMTDRTLRFTNTTTNKVFDFTLPDDLLIEPNSGTYDEFYFGVNNEGRICTVTKRCKYNSDGSIGLLDNEVVNSYTYEEAPIPLTDGDYEIQLLGYNNAYMSIRLMAQNIYTTQFATVARLTSEISQTATNILAEVSEEYATIDTTNSLSSRINLTAKSIELVTTDNNTSAGITIRLKNEDGTQIDSKTANITMSGKVSFNDLSTSGSTVINGSNITTGIIKSSNYVANSAGTSINLSNGVIDTKNFKVDASGNITANNATISGNITATSGTFQNCTITNSCSVPASTVSGTLATNNIPNLSASKITSGTISSSVLYGVDASFGRLSATGAISSGGSISAHEGYSSWGQNGVGTLAIPQYLIVQHEGQYWRRLKIVGGLIVEIKDNW